MFKPVQFIGSTLESNLKFFLLAFVVSDLSLACVDLTTPFTGQLLKSLEFFLSLSETFLVIPVCSISTYFDV
jgi:hypothetical protein